MAEEAKKDTQNGAGASETTTEKTEQTIGDIQEGAAPTPKKEKGPEPETVGLDKFLDLKKENKKLAQSLKDLEDSIKKGATTTEVSDDIDAIAKEFDVDPAFISKISKLAEAKAMARAEEISDLKLKPIAEEKRAELIDKAFTKHFNDALEKMPEFAKIVNRDVIKQLSLNPANKDKTFIELIEETYGNAVPGKRTIETTKPGGGKEPAPLDIARAKKDNEYFKEIMSDPKLKKEYNEAMLREPM